MSIELIIFWVAGGLLVYTYVGYPLLVYVWASIDRHSYHHDNDYEPRVTILVVAYNEAANVNARLDNLLALDYPKHRVDIMFASDGSTDGTVNSASHYIEKGVRVVEFRQRRGKPAVLNDLVPQAKGHIVVLTDMRQRFEPSALRALVAPFVDTGVGAVTGELVLAGGKNESAAGEGVGFYWKYEKFIRRQESCIDSTVGVSGAIYALRRALFRPIAIDTILDDVVIPMNIVRQDYRVVYEPAARAYDNMIISANKELIRKIRTIAGNYQLLIRQPWLLNPFINRLWLQTLSHKYCRLTAPPCLLLVLLANYQLLSQSLYQGLLVLQIVFYLAAYTGHVNKSLAKRTALINVPYTFCLLNWATVMGFVRYITGRQSVTWNRGQQNQ